MSYSNTINKFGKSKLNAAITRILNGTESEADITFVDEAVFYHLNTTGNLLDGQLYDEFCTACGVKL